MTVEPSGRTAGGFRLYTQHDVERLLLPADEFIQGLQLHTSAE
ncbi:hypothetical protein [Nesterenkonia sp.]|nr:hypothetical protein [Nesterenkonia sp.]